MAEERAFLRLKKAALGVIVHLQSVQSSLPAALQPPLRELDEAIAASSVEDLMASLPVLTLPVYTIITTPAPNSRPSKHDEVKVVAAALKCTESLVRRCGPSFIDTDPSIYLKFFTHLTLRMATLGSEDSSRSVEWSVEEGAVLSTLRALIECRGPLRCGEEQRGSSDSDEEDWDSRQRWSEVLRALVQAVNGAIVAQAVQAMLDVAAKDKDREMRLLSLSTLSSLVQLLPCPDVWRPFLPGVFGGLAKVVLGDWKQGSRITSTALSTCLTLTALLTSDSATAPAADKDRPDRPEGKAAAEWQALCSRLTSTSSAPPMDSAMPTLSIPVPAKLAVPVTSSWLEDLGRRLSELLPLLLKGGRESPSARVRRATAEGAGLFVRSSPAFLRRHVALARDVIDTAVALQQDDDEGVAGVARRLVAEHLAAAALSSSSSSPFPSTTTDGAPSFSSSSSSWATARLTELFGQLPRIASSSAHDRPLRSTLDLIAGYLTLLLAAASGHGRSGQGGGMVQQLLATQEATPILDSLSQALAFDPALNLQVIDPLPSGGGYYRPTFQHLRDEAQGVDRARLVLRLLGRGAGGDGLYVLADHVLTRLQAERRGRRRRSAAEWSRERLPLVYALNHILLGAAEGPGQSAGQGVGQNGHGRGGQTGQSPSSFSALLPAVRLLLEGLMGPSAPRTSAWRLRTCIDDEEEEGAAVADDDVEHDDDGTRRRSRQAMSAEEMDANGMLVALLVEGVGNCAEVAAKADALGPLLRLILYPLLEKMGHGHPLVRQAALTTLHRLARLTAAGSIRGLVCGNLDYLVDALCSRMRRGRRGSSGRRQRGSRFPVKPGVLECLMTYATTSNDEDGEEAEGGDGGRRQKSARVVAAPLMREVAALALEVVDEQGGQGHRYVNGMMRVLRAMVRHVPPDQQPTTRRKGRKRERAWAVPAQDFWRRQVLHDCVAWGLGGKEEEDAAEDGSAAVDHFTRLHRERLRRDADDGGKLEAEKLLDTINEAMQGQEEDGAAAANDEEEEEEGDDHPTESEALVIDILDRCAHFLASPSLLVQHTALAAMADALGHLEPRRYVLLPTVHRIWPALTARLRECGDILTPTHRPGIDETHTPDSQRSTATLVLIKLLDLISVLAGLCGDYLSLKFGEELWPQLRRLLQAGQARASRAGLLTADRLRCLTSPTASATAADTITPRISLKGRSARAMPLESKGIEAVVRCLMSFCEADDCYMYTTPLVHDMGMACLYLLAHEDKEDLPPSPKASASSTSTSSCSSVMRLYRALLRLDGAALWPVLMASSGWDITTRPMRRAQQPAVTVEGLDGKQARVLQQRAAELVEVMTQGRGGEVAWCMGTE